MTTFSDVAPPKYRLYQSLCQVFILPHLLYSKTNISLPHEIVDESIELLTTRWVASTEDREETKNEVVVMFIHRGVDQSEGVMEGRVKERQVDDGGTGWDIDHSSCWAA